MPRCVCGHSYDMHIHLRHGRDCGEHGRWACPAYVPLNERDTARLVPAQRVALAESDAHLYRNLWALAQFAQGSRPAPVVDIPRQRTQHVSDYLDERRRRGRKGPDT